MIKKKFYIISKKARYGEETLHRCTDLNSTMELFKFLVQSNTVEVESVSVPDNTKEPDEDAYVPSVYIKYEKGEAEYHIGTEIVDMYSKEEVDKIKADRDAWLKPFEDKAAKDKATKKVKKKKKGTKK